MVETYVDQLTLWTLLPDVEGRLAIKGIFTYENKPIAGNKCDGIQSVLNAISLTSSHFVIVLAEPASLLSSPSKADVQCVVHASEQPYSTASRPGGLEELSLRPFGETGQELPSSARQLL